MKIVLLAISTFAFLGARALAQDNIAGKDWDTFFSTYKAGTFAAIGKRKFGVHTEGNLERGYYFETSATTVQFFICPSGPSIPLEVTKIAPEPTDECSVPGRPIPPISIGLAAKWTYDADKSGFIVTSANQPSVLTFPCKDTSSKMLAAVKLAQSKDYGVVADANDDYSKLVAKYLNFDLKNLAADESGAAPSETDCAQAGDFWTYPIGETVQNAQRKTLAVTKIEPTFGDK